MLNILSVKKTSQCRNQYPWTNPSSLWHLGVPVHNVWFLPSLHSWFLPLSQVLPTYTRLTVRFLMPPIMAFERRRNMQNKNNRQKWLKMKWGNAGRKGKREQETEREREQSTSSWCSQRELRQYCNHKPRGCYKNVPKKPRNPKIVKFLKNWDTL